VKQQIDHQLSSARKQLNDLGQDRETSDQQRRFLQEIAGHFQKMTDHALDAYYSRGVVFDKIPELRLPTLVIDRSDKFNNNILKFGHAVELRSLESQKKTMIRIKALRLQVRRDHLSR
jgi:hypothetical protein